MVTDREVHFLSSEGAEQRKIVRVNLDTFEERVLDKLKENIADFLVDENQTITYLTSQGELIQENVDNNTSIPRTCVTLNSQLDGAVWTCLTTLDYYRFISAASSSFETPKKQIFLQVSTTFKVFSHFSMELPGAQYASKFGLTSLLSARDEAHQVEIGDIHRRETHLRLHPVAALSQ